MRRSTSRKALFAHVTVFSNKSLAIAFSCCLLALTSNLPARSLTRQSAPAADPQKIAMVRDYIRKNWKPLTRSLQDLPVALPDSKIEHVAGRPWPLYVAPGESRQKLRSHLGKILSADALKRVSVQRLPREFTPTQPHGLLYLPHPYVVPGGRFNEMYGWDSYFIQVGLLHDQETSLAKAMTDNFIYQIERYGTILNANRTYYLTRSQPPFLTAMILGVYHQTKNKIWLRGTLPSVEKYYEYWTTGPHVHLETGLSRYYDSGAGPAPEVVAGERDAYGKTHYDRVREYYKTHAVTDYDVTRFYDAASDKLTEAFYKGDRSMRESGFDPSNRFGPFNADVVNYAPVCLNSLLYKMETEAAEIARELGDDSAFQAWLNRAHKRSEAIQKYLWDEPSGLFLDYNFQTHSRRMYPFATTFYPLWVGAATPAQADAVLRNLSKFEVSGGILTSVHISGNQWDAPFGWAPLQMIAVNGLRRYGFKNDADRLAQKFVATVTKEFQEHGVIVEKYDVVRRESDVSADIRFGYNANEIGFGWTNGAFLELLKGLGWKL